MTLRQRRKKKLKTFTGMGDVEATTANGVVYIAHVSKSLDTGKIPREALLQMKQP